LRPIIQKTGKGKRGSMSKEESKYVSKGIEQGCILCRYKDYGISPAEWHHLRTGTGGGAIAPHDRGIPLCPAHHRNGPMALHGVGRKQFERLHNVTEQRLFELSDMAIREELE